MNKQKVSNESDLIDLLGASLGSLYSWNTAIDVEALQVLLCIKQLADQQGYAQIASIRKTVGMTPDRMTRCLRMLQGNKKSIPIISGIVGARQPLIDEVTYNDSPTVRRIGLTSFGEGILDKIVSPFIAIHEQVKAQEELIERQRRMLGLIEDIGFDLTKIDAASTGAVDGLWQAGGNQLLKAVMNDLASKNALEIAKLDLPSVLQIMKHQGFVESEELDRNEQERVDFRMFHAGMLLK